MNYEYFAEMEAGTLLKAEDESEQAFMERVLSAVISECPEDTCVRFNERLNPSFCGCDAERRSVTVAFSTEEWMLNPNGTLHGGISAAAVDIVMSVLTRFLMKKRIAVTVQLNTTYLKTIQRGERFVVCVTADHAGRRCVMTRAEVTGENSGRLAMTASGVLM